MTTKALNSRVSWMISVGISITVASVLCAYFFYTTLPDSKYLNESLHSVVESFGSVVAIVLASLFLTQRSRVTEVPMKYIRISNALIFMGILDFFHAVLPINGAFGWSKAISVLVGGLIFSAVWLPETIVTPRVKKTLPYLWVGLGTTVGVLLAIFTRSLPLTIVDGHFSLVAKLMSAASGFCFLASSIFFIRMYRKTSASEDFLFGQFAILFSISSFLFPISQIWGAVWWLVHGLRLSSYTVLFIYGLRSYQNLKKELNKADSLFHNIAENSHDAMFIRDLTGKYIMSNHAGGSLIGTTADHLVNTYDYDHFPPETVAKNREYEAIVLATQKSVTFEREVITHHQKNVFLVTLAPYLNENQEITGFTGIARDVSEYKATLEKLREAEVTRETKKRLAGVVGNAEIILWAIDTQGIFTLSEGRGLEKIGLKPGERVGRSIFELYQHNPAVMQDIRNGLAGQEIKAQTHVNGTWYSIQYSPIRNEQNQVTGLVAACIDITFQKEAEQEKEKRLQAEQATKAKSEFLANMSHEIRTPINGVIGMTEILLDTELKPEQKEYAETIQGCAETLLKLVNDILDFSKVEAGKLDLEIIDFSLEQLVADTEKLMFHSASLKGLKLFRSMASTVPASLNGDPGRLRQILVNLISNGIKFTDRGQVTIEVGTLLVTDTEAKLRFEITDTGIGISETSMSKLFEVFSQADASTTRKYGGTGLGLSICKRLVALMRGEIGLRSTEGVGSTFWFTVTLPIGKSAVVETPVRQLRPNSQRLRVLIAEDNQVNQIVAKKMVEKIGHSAHTVANGLEVLAALKVATYDLILMDCQMPEMDGYEATKVIRDTNASWNTIPIIALTANAMAGDREKCLAAGMNHYVAKPIREQDLAAAVEIMIFGT
jgi:PAS domain S-box-containing protein